MVFKNIENKRAIERRYYQRYREEILLRKRQPRAREINKLATKKYYEAHKKDRNFKKNASNIARKNIPLAQFCELCPEDDKRKPMARHHPNHNYPLIVISVCSQCHRHCDRNTVEVD